MVWICDQCIENQHAACKTKWQCDCQCNIGGGADVTQKSLAIVGGTTLAITGIAATLCTGGLAAAIFGSAMLGAGFGSTWNAAAKIAKHERIDAKIYANDIVFGVVTGVITSGLGVPTETMATSIVQQAVVAGTEKISVSTTNNTVDQLKRCSAPDKNRSDTENEATVTRADTASSRRYSFSSNSVDSNIHDASMNKMNTIITHQIVIRTDKEAIDATFEVDEFNNTVMNKNNCEQVRQTTKIIHHPMSEEQKKEYQSAIRKYDSDIRAEISLRNEAVRNRNILLIQEHQNKIAELMQQKDEEIIKLNSIPMIGKMWTIECVYDDNAHFLSSDKIEQITSNVKSPTTSSQQSKRKTYDHDVTKLNDTDYFRRLKIAETMLNNAIYNSQ